MSSSVLFDSPGPKARARNRIYAVAGSAALLGLIAFIVYRLAAKGHLDGAMWDIFNYAGVRNSIAKGLVSTLEAFAIAGVLSLVLAVLLAVARLSDHRPVSWVATGVIELFRAVPLLITIYVLWVGFFTSDPLWAVVIGLTLYNGAVQAEVLRAGILAVPKGQSEAAYALGMSKTQVMTTVLIPQAVRSMLPTIVSQLVVTLKDTSLGFVITYEELLYAGRQMASTILVDGENPYVPVVLVFGAIYVAMCLALSALANWIEKRGRRAKTGIKVAEAQKAAPDMGGGAGPAT
ncbi:amino acid ABC transporter permease [Streptomyces abyssalis]|uniref:Amino acid ABC transporter permease n=1 Tax=Streptomyces abyssalis TaxID=933944 RepID=A0A1E7JHN9_9ACTN|nr:amino acid ABC transporter permease [Streptomyces abyssalis]OEU85979.1 amino acid ABC transporter permease [Streptomyces abyssalis]OEU92552.1 amino acid ABC transporter permease [Streptomyces abyssalis]OEV28907.1 amino acid ABC transporter permease [Streptomyces nanshensis]